MNALDELMEKGDKQNSIEECIAIAYGEGIGQPDAAAAELAAMQEVIDAVRELSVKWMKEGEMRKETQVPGTYMMLSTLAGCGGALDDILKKLDGLK